MEDATMVLSTMVEGGIGAAMMFTAYQIGVEARQGHGKDVGIGAALAFFGTVISFFIGTFLARWMLPAALAPHWPALSAALSATDPVAVSALVTAFSLFLGGATGMVKKLGIILETESLLNDPLALILFLVAQGRREAAIDGLVMGLGLALVIIVLSYTFVRNYGRRASTWVRVIATFAAIIFGAQHHAALITLSVVANIVAGILEAPYHHESHARIDATLFWSGNAALFVTVGAGLIILVPLALANIPVAINGGIFMLVVRIISRTFGLGLFNRTWRTLAIGGAGAVGVIAIAALVFSEDGNAMAAAVAAGAGLGSLIAFIGPTIYMFRNWAKTGNGNGAPVAA